MKTEFKKWGNSLALRVPIAVAKQVGASEGKRVEMTVEGNAIVIKVVHKRRRYRLQDLVAGMTEENCHSETDWGAPVGNEIW